MTEKLLHSNGWLCDCVEHYNAHSGRSHDLYGFADYIANKPWINRIAAIQITTKSNKSARFNKIIHNIDAFFWLKSGGEIWLLTWARVSNQWVPERMILAWHHFPKEFLAKSENYMELKRACAFKELRETKKIKMIEL